MVLNLSLKKKEAICAFLLIWSPSVPFGKCFPPSADGKICFLLILEVLCNRMSCWLGSLPGVVPASYDRWLISSIVTVFNSLNSINLLVRILNLSNNEPHNPREQRQPCSEQSRELLGISNYNFHVSCGRNSTFLIKCVCLRKDRQTAKWWVWHRKQKRRREKNGSKWHQ